MRDDCLSLERKIREELESFEQGNSQVDSSTLLKRFNEFCFKLRRFGLMKNNQKLKIQTFHITQHDYDCAVLLLDLYQKYPSFAELVRTAIRNLIKSDFEEISFLNKTRGELESDK